MLTRKMKKYWPLSRKEEQSKKRRQGSHSGSEQEETNCIRKKKAKKDNEKPQGFLRKSKGQKNIANIKTAKRSILIPKINNANGEVVTSRKGTANVFGEFKKLFDDDDEKAVKTNKEGEEGKDSEENNTAEGESMNEIPEFTKEKKKCKMQSIASKEAKQVTAMESEPRTSKNVTKRRKR